MIRWSVSSLSASLIVTLLLPGTGFATSTQPVRAAATPSCVLKAYKLAREDNGVRVRARSRCDTAAKRVLITELLVEFASGRKSLKSRGLGEEFGKRGETDYWAACDGWGPGTEDDPAVRISNRVTLRRWSSKTREGGKVIAKKQSAPVAWADLCPGEPGY